MLVFWSLSPTQRAAWHRRIGLHFCLCIVCACGIFVSHGVQAAVSPGLNADAFGDYFVPKVPLQNDQTLVHVYRLADSDGAVPINIYINGRYHASLLAGGHVSFCVKPQNLNFQAVFDDAAQLHVGKKDRAYTFAAAPGAVQHLRVQTEGGRTTQVQWLAEETALDQIKATRMQLHTVSRVAEVEKCRLGPKPEAKALTPLPAPLPSPVPMSVPVPAPAPVVATPAPVAAPAKPAVASTQKIVLGADALFDFGKHQLTPSGKRSIRKLALQVRQSYVSIESVRVIGHSDPLGAAALNRQLSLERSFSVVRVLEQEGVKSRNGFEANGLGPAQLLKRTCLSEPHKQARSGRNIACHAKNRRVEIVVIGTKKLPNKKP
jgi:OmpA-OmpF porin, OOP family